MNEHTLTMHALLLDPVTAMQIKLCTCRLCVCVCVCARGGGTVHCIENDRSTMTTFRCVSYHINCVPDTHYYPPFLNQVVQSVLHTATLSHTAHGG